MKRITKLVLALIVAATAVALWRIQRPPEIIDAPAVVYEAKTNEGGEVTVTVAPLRLTQGFPASFDIAFETHSVDLTFEVEDVATLTDETNTLYTPYWEGSPPGGHHRAGTLRFTPDLSKLGNVTLTLKNIAETAQRTFVWEVK